jgi:hypothetical protein
VSGTGADAATSDVTDTFQERVLNPNWEWPVEHKPVFSLDRGELDLAPPASIASDPLGGVLARTTTSLLLRASVRIARVNGGSTLASIALIGNAGNAAGIGVEQDQVVQWRRDQGGWRRIISAPLPPGKQIFLAIESKASQHLSTSWSLDGTRWNALGESEVPLPPWDSGLRVGLTCGGDARAQARFSNFHLITRK